jgi:O-antigen biosynthesis protein WbqV
VDFEGWGARGLGADAGTETACSGSPIYTFRVTSPLESIRWDRFLARPRLPTAPLAAFRALDRHPMLITGAGGSIGSALALRLGVLTPPRLLLLEASEGHLYALKRQWAAAGLACPMTPILGNANDHSLLEHIFSAHAPRIVFHAAAFKHVELMEEHPLAAIANNVFVTEALARAAQAHGAHLVLLSTDKAVEPVSVMGATKRVAEQIVLASGGTVLRMGNVLGSRDSVVQTFAAQIAAGGPITVTDPAARRYFVTLDEAVNLLMIASALDDGPALLAPILPAPHYISDLAHFMADELAPGRKIELDFTALRPGDKDTELFWSAGDRTRTASPEALVSIDSTLLTQEQLGVGLAHLRAALEIRNLGSSIQHLCGLVPDYKPSSTVLALARQDGPHHWS